MSYTVENLEKSMAKITITVDADAFEEAMVKSYNKNKKNISIQGFRKGKAPRKMVEKLYGPEVFYEDAANFAIPDAYEEAAKESGLEIVSRPEIDVVEIEKGKDFVFTATVAVKPEVTLGDYKGIEVEKTTLETTPAKKLYSYTCPGFIPLLRHRKKNSKNLLKLSLLRGKKKR